MSNPEQKKSVPDRKENAQENNDLKTAQKIEEQIAPENYEKLSEEELDQVAGGILTPEDEKCPECGSSNSSSNPVFKSKMGLYRCVDCGNLFFKGR